MKVPGLEQQVELQPMPNAKLQSSATPTAFGVNVGQATEHMGKTISAVGSQLEKKQEEQWAKDNKLAFLTNVNKMTQDVTAMFNDPVNNLTAQEDAAIGAASRAKKILDEKIAKYRANMTNKAQMEMFDSYAPMQLDTLWNSALRHEVTQKEVAAKKQAAGLVDNATEAAALQGWSSAGLQARSRVVATIDTAYSYEPVEFRNKRALEKMDYINNQWVGSLYAKGDYAGAKKIIDSEKKYMLSSTYNAWDARLREAIKKVTTLSDIDKVMQNPNILTNGKIDITKVDVEARKMAGITIPDPNNLSWEQAKQILIAGESGGNANAHNGDSGAHGLIQFMPDTWKGIMGDAPMTSENQQAAIDKHYRPIFEKYGLSGVLAVVYAGDQIAALKNKPHEGVYHTTVAEVPAQVAQNVQHSGTDFAIVTYPAHHEQAVNLGTLNPDAPVTLNEYNLYGYKKVIRGISVYANSSLSGVGEVSADVSRRITKTGKYLGVAAAYDLEKNKPKLD